jgi:hypothetical protein
MCAFRCLVARLSRRSSSVETVRNMILLEPCARAAQRQVQRPSVGESTGERTHLLAGTRAHRDGPCARPILVQCLRSKPRMSPARLRLPRPPPPQPPRLQPPPPPPPPPPPRPLLLHLRRHRLHEPHLRHCSGPPASWPLASHSECRPPSALRAQVDVRRLGGPCSPWCLTACTRSVPHIRRLLERPLLDLNGGLKNTIQQRGRDDAGRARERASDGVLLHTRVR